MVVLAAIMGAGCICSLLSGGSLGRLRDLRLRGETFLLGVLTLQLLLPAAQLGGIPGVAAYWVWLLTFPPLVFLCLANSRHRPLVLVAIGLMLNGLVIAANGGMPVSPEAVGLATGGGQLAIRAGDFAHVAMSASTRLSWLGDTLPVPGPSFLRAVVSPGDLLLGCGVAGLLASTALKWPAGGSLEVKK